MNVKYNIIIKKNQNYGKSISNSANLCLIKAFRLHGKCDKLYIFIQDTMSYKHFEIYKNNIQLIE